MRDDGRLTERKGSGHVLEHVEKEPMEYVFRYQTTDGTQNETYKRIVLKSFFLTNLRIWCKDLDPRTHKLVSQQRSKGWNVLSELCQLMYTIVPFVHPIAAEARRQRWPTICNRMKGHVGAASN